MKTMQEVNERIEAFKGELREIESCKDDGIRHDVIKETLKSFYRIQIDALSWVLGKKREEGH